jgi:hypothetical protein
MFIKTVKISAFDYSIYVLYKEKFLQGSCALEASLKKILFIVIHLDSGCHGEETVLRPEQPATDHEDKDPYIISDGIYLYIIFIPYYGTT